MSRLTQTTLVCTHDDCDFRLEDKMYTDPEKVAEGTSNIHRQLVGEDHEVVVQEHR